MRGHGESSWTLLAGGTLLSRTSISSSVSGLNLSFSNCTVVPNLPGSTITLPGFTGTIGSGASPLWAFVYFGNNSGRVVTVTNGSAASQATITGGSTCGLNIIGGFVQDIPTSIADSSSVAQAVQAAGGSAFLQVHPQANVTMAVTGGISVFIVTTPPTWKVAYSLCSLSATGASTALEFNATVNAQGAVTNTHAGSTNCSAASLLGSLTGSGGLALFERTAQQPTSWYVGTALLGRLT
jgi:hypothetical protein